MNTVVTPQVARFTDIARVERPQGYAHRRFLVSGAIDRHTDIELLEFRDYTPYFGGRVHRSENTAVVIVHTD